MARNVLSRLTTNKINEETPVTLFQAPVSPIVIAEHHAKVLAMKQMEWRGTLNWQG